ncbi:MAG: hypothetical protein AAF802_12505 [Planctomycetota bacterium]
MSSQLQMQPAFRVTLPWPREEAKQRLRHAIKNDDMGAIADSAGWVLDYQIPSSQRRFWSPHLSVQLSKLEEETDQCEAFCRFSPRPEIWTMVMAIYLIASCILLAAAILGFVQWMLNRSPWAFLVVPASMLVIGSLHVASLIGQGWSKDQMLVLRDHWERTVELAKEEQTNDSS